jgi:hypothetical protein
MVAASNPCAHCNATVPAGTRRRVRDRLYLCQSFACHTAFTTHTVTHRYKAFTPAFREAVASFVTVKGRTVTVYHKDLGRLTDAANDNARVLEEQKTRTLAERCFNGFAIGAGIFNPARKVHPHRLLATLASDPRTSRLFPALHLATSRGMAAVTAHDPPISMFTALTMENAEAFVDEASRLRDFGEMVSEFVTAQRAPATVHFKPDHWDDSFASTFAQYCRFDLGLVLMLASDDMLRGYARRTARAFMESRYLVGEPVTFTWPWLSMPLLSTSIVEGVPLGYFAFEEYIERFGLVRTCSRPWSRETHLEVSRPWAIWATQTLLLVLNRYGVTGVLIDTIISCV